MKIRILVVEDEPSLLRLIAKRLKEYGYSVDSCDNGDDGEYYAELTEYDCIILDIMIPVKDGLTVLRNLRRKGIVTPVLLLTAKSDIDDRVHGLDIGADDYLIKPFSFKELLARIRVLLRRNIESRTNQLSIADLTLDATTRIVMRAGKVIDLTSKEYSILEYLLRNKEKIVSRTQIAEHVWNYDSINNSNIVDVYIRYLRGKIDDKFDNKLIHTVRGTGYVLKEKA
jgi:DNA-binding response OmpR family regulator